MDEHAFIRNLHSKLPPDIYKWKIHDVYAGGVPDAYYSGPKGHCWVEYKYVSKLPAKPTTCVVKRQAVTQLQKKWLNTASEHGQHAFLIIGAEDKVVILSRGEWDRDITKEYFDDNALPIKAVIRWIESICTTGHPATL